MAISEKRRLFEILAVIITGLGKFLFMDILGFRLLYISCACIFWLKVPNINPNKLETKIAITNNNSGLNSNVWICP